MEGRTYWQGDVGWIVSRQLSEPMNAPVRIQFVLPSFAGGGAERILLTLLRALDRSRFQVGLTVISGSGPLSHLVPSDVTSTDLRCGRLATALPKLRQSLLDDQPDVVFSTMAHLNSGVLSVSPFLPSRTRFVVREANVPLKGLDGLKRHLQTIAYRRLYHRAHAVVCPSRCVRDGVAALSPPSRNKLSVIHNPIDVEHFRQQASAPIRQPGSGPRLVAVGRLTHQKGFDRIIELLPNLPPDTHLTIVGDGPDRLPLEKSIADLSLSHRVTLTGHITNPWAVIAGADALVLPSRWEGLPNVVLEALACGTPVIATPEAGGINEIAVLATKAVTVVDIGPGFTAAISGLFCRSGRPAPDPSLLPKAFMLGTIVPQYVDLFESLAAG